MKMAGLKNYLLLCEFHILRIDELKTAKTEIKQQAVISIQKSANLTWAQLL